MGDKEFKMTAKAAEPRDILVVDDDAHWRTVVREALPPARYRVHEASSAAEGVAMARAIRPAAIVLDVVLPGGTDGLMTLCELQRYPRTRFIPVIVFSEIGTTVGLGFTPKDIRAHLGIAPAAVIPKPANAARLRREIGRVIRDMAPAAAR